MDRSAPELLGLTPRDVAPVPDDEINLNDAFTEWDESMSFPSGSRPVVIPAAARAATRSDPLTTGLLAEASRHSRTRDLQDLPLVRRRSGPTPESLEEAIRSVMDDDGRDDNDEPVRYAAGSHAAR